MKLDQRAQTMKIIEEELRKYLKENSQLLEIFENKNQSDIAEDLINWRLGYEIKDWGMKI